MTVTRHELLQTWVVCMVQIALQGIPDIRKVALREAKRIVPSPNAPDGYTNDNEWILDTEGVNLKEVNMITKSCIS